MEIPSENILTKYSVTSLGRLAVMLVSKRRQLGIRVSIEPRYIELIQEVDRFTLRKNKIMLCVKGEYNITLAGSET